jgi:hypothetical protein
MLTYDFLGHTYDIVGAYDIVYITTSYDLRCRNIFSMHSVYDIVGPNTPTTSYVMAYDIVGHKEIISYTISLVSKYIRHRR